MPSDMEGKIETPWHDGNRDGWDCEGLILHCYILVLGLISVFQPRFCTRPSSHGQVYRVLNLYSSSSFLPSRLLSYLFLTALCDLLHPPSTPSPLPVMNQVLERIELLPLSPPEHTFRIINYH